MLISEITSSFDIVESPTLKSPKMTWRWTVQKMRKHYTGKCHLGTANWQLKTVKNGKRKPGPYVATGMMSNEVDSCQLNTWSENHLQILTTCTTCDFFSFSSLLFFRSSIFLRFS